MFAVSDFKTKEWHNFRQLQKVTRIFMFKTAFWNREFIFTNDEEEQKEGSPAKPPTTTSPVRDSQQQKIPKPKEGKEFVLTRERKKLQNAWDAEEIDGKNYGIHWNDEGQAMDIVTCEKMIHLFKALNLNEFDPSLRPTLLEGEKKFFHKMASDYEFWEDAKKLLETIKLQDIEETHLTTHRRVRHWVKDFLEKSHRKADRRALLKDIARALNRSID